MNDQLFQLLHDPGLVSVVGDKVIILILIIGLLVLLGISVGAFGSAGRGGVVPSPGPAPVPTPVPAPTNPAPPAPPPAPPVNTGPQRFAACVALVLGYEGGNDDDPNDPGGRTSRGIIQTEWNTWRQTHPGLPSDVWQAPQDQVLAIYQQNYWNAQSCDDLAPGVDMVVFDYGVNSGLGRSGPLLQQLVGLTGDAVDGEIGPITIAAAAKVTDVPGLINKFCDARLAFLKGLGTWSVFGNGWSSRVADVRKQALAMAAGASTSMPTTPTIPSTPTLTGDPPWLAKARTYLGKTWSSGNPPQWMLDLIDGIKNNAANKATAGFAGYCDALKSGYRPWCGIFVAGCLAASGKPVPFVNGNDEGSFAWAPAWDTYGTAVTGDPQAGDVFRFEWHGGGEHVTFDEGFYPNDALRHILGGNQGNHVVSIATEPMDDELVAIRRPPT